MEKVKLVIALKGWKSLAYILAIGGIIGLLAAFSLTTEKIHLIKDASYQPPCNLNPIISCGSIMKTPQAEVFGFPNSLLGLIGFAIVTTIGMALLAGASFKRWFWLGLEAGALFGVIFVHWLFYQSLYVIGALCPYCMVVWAVTIPIFLYTTIFIIKNGFMTPPESLKKIVQIVLTYHRSILVAWYFAIIMAILIRFWSYWSTLL